MAKKKPPEALSIPYGTGEPEMPTMPTDEPFTPHAEPKSIVPMAPDVKASGLSAPTVPLHDATKPKVRRYDAVTQAYLNAQRLFRGLTEKQRVELYLRIKLDFEPPLLNPGFPP